MIFFTKNPNLFFFGGEGGGGMGLELVDFFYYESKFIGRGGGGGRGIE